MQITISLRRTWHRDHARRHASTVAALILLLVLVLGFAYKPLVALIQRN